jgi:hypothetical protein
MGTHEGCMWGDWVGGEVWVVGGWVQLTMW